MRLLSLAVVLMLLAAPAAGSPRAVNVHTKLGCLNLKASDRVMLTGGLRLQDFAGPPNFESVAAGDTLERTFILILAGPICLDDGGEGFADPSRQGRRPLHHRLDRPADRGRRGDPDQRREWRGAGAADHGAAGGGS